MSKIREILNHPLAGWVAAIALVIFYSLNPRVKTIKKTETLEVVKWRTRVVTQTNIQAKAGSVTKIDKDGGIIIEGPVDLSMTRSETGTGESKKTARTVEKTIPLTWRWRVGASVLVPNSFNLIDVDKQLEMDMNIGRVLLWDVSVGGRVQFPAASWAPKRYGAAVSVTF